MRLLLGVVIAGGLLAGCNQADTDSGELRATSTISDAELSNAAGTEDSRSDDPETTSPVQPGPGLEDEPGYGLNRGLAQDGSVRSDFENFLMTQDGVEVERNVASSDNRIMTADRLDMDFNSFIGLYRSDVDVENGTTFAGEITLWTESGQTAEIVLQLTDFCSSNGTDTGTERVTIGDVPTEYAISHEFSAAHECALFRVTNVTEGGGIVFADNARLRED